MTRLSDAATHQPHLVSPPATDPVGMSVAIAAATSSRARSLVELPVDRRSPTDRVDSVR